MPTVYTVPTQYICFSSLGFGSYSSLGGGYPCSRENETFKLLVVLNMVLNSAFYDSFASLEDLEVRYKLNPTDLGM